jgi:orotidine-5'-phosphate decarboxylase
MIPRETGLILALDVDWDVDKSAAFLGSINDLIDAAKIGWFQLLNIGPWGIRELVNKVGKYFLADLKLGDVSHINEYVIRRIHELGINGIIMHSVAGKDNLTGPVRVARELGVDVYLLVSMSSGGELYDTNLEYNVELGVELGVSGFVVPATKPNVIRRVRSMVGGGYQLLSPGVGAQGGKPGCAIANGADFEIVGRAILTSPDPRRTTLDFIDLVRKPSC